METRRNIPGPSQQHAFHYPMINCDPGPSNFAALALNPWHFESLIHSSDDAVIAPWRARIVLSWNQSAECDVSCRSGIHRSVIGNANSSRPDGQEAANSRAKFRKLAAECREIHEASSGLIDIAGQTGLIREPGDRVLGDVPARRHAAARLTRRAGRP